MPLSYPAARTAGFLLFLASLFLFGSVARADQAVSALIGQNATFTVTALGNTPFTYQWRKNGNPISGANSSTLVLSNLQVSDSGIYTAVINNSVGNTISDQGIITVTAANEPPVITTQPVSHSAQQGSSTNFVVVATGIPAPTYQWQKNSSNLVDGGGVSGATTNTLTLSNVTSANDGSYTVIVTNAAGSVTSDVTAFTAFTPPVVNQAPQFITQPANQSTFVGQSLNLTATASGNPAVAYQWQKEGIYLLDGGRISGANSPTLVINNTTTADAGNYSLIAANSIGTATSATATVSITTFAVPIITKQPVSQTGSNGGLVFFSVQAFGFPAPSLQWRKNGVNLSNGASITGVRSTTLSITVTDANVAGTYSAVATNVVGEAISNDAILTVNGTPGFQNQPPALTVVSSGTNVTLSLLAPGATSLQWRRNNAAINNGGNISGATSTTLVLSNVTTSDSGIYSVVATSATGTATSNSFEVVVLPSNVSNQTVTAGHNVTLSGGAASGSLQWQVLSGPSAQWTNLPNNGIYRGVTTDLLEITGATESQNGNQYRLVSNPNGTPTVIRTVLLTVGAALIPFPVGVAADAQGNLYVTDTSTDTLQKVDNFGHVSLFAGTAGSAGSSDGSGSAARFNDPTGIVATSNGNIGITDNANATIRLATTFGTVSTLAGSTTSRGNNDGTGSAATFSSPSGIAADSAGNFYVADATNHTIRKVTSSTGTVTTFAGSAGSSGSADGTGSAARFNRPTGIAVGVDGTVYVSDTTNNLIRKITSSGVVTTFAGLVGVSGSSDGAGNAALFNRPTGLGIDSNNNLYVSDTGNSTIRQISPGGAVTTYAGLAGIAGLKDGVGGEAWLNQPQDVTVAPSGIVYVADTGNAIVRQIAPGGMVTSLGFTRLAETPPSTVPSLPSSPPLPDPLPTPTLPTGPSAPTPAPSGGGGGGSPSLWFLVSLSIIWLARRFSSR